MPMPMPTPAPTIQPSCSYFPVSALCLAPLLRSLPACAQHLWVDTGNGWACVPQGPTNPPLCKPPWTFPMLVSRAWECLGGPGPVMLPMQPKGAGPMQQLPMYPPVTVRQV